MRRFLFVFLVLALISGALYFQPRPANHTVVHHTNHPPVASISDAFTHF
ncbi:hypothetical protein ACEN9D_04145 [Pseudomonas sp. CT11-2]|jgi:hypothetical protein|nr:MULTISPECIES: hypothetical protein [Pseudomonas]UVM35749.1 hypothetical protein LOY36_13945 [Pseudomonas sp. B21-019]